MKGSIESNKSSSSTNVKRNSSSEDMTFLAEYSDLEKLRAEKRSPEQSVSIKLAHLKVKTDSENADTAVKTIAEMADGAIVPLNPNVPSEMKESIQQATNVEYSQTGTYLKIMGKSKPKTTGSKTTVKTIGTVYDQRTTIIHNHPSSERTKAKVLSTVPINAQINKIDAIITTLSHDDENALMLILQCYAAKLRILENQSDEDQDDAIEDAIYAQMEAIIPTYLTRCREQYHWGRLSQTAAGIAKLAYDDLSTRLRQLRLGLDGIQQRDVVDEKSLNKVNSKLRKLSVTLFSFANELLGGAPQDTPWAIVLLGSIARGLATPYSDIEYIVLLDDDDNNSRLHFERQAIVLKMLLVCIGQSPLRKAWALLQHHQEFTAHKSLFTALGLRLDFIKQAYVDTESRKESLVNTPEQLLDPDKPWSHKRGDHTSWALLSPSLCCGSSDATDLMARYWRALVRNVKGEHYQAILAKLHKQDQESGVELRGTLKAWFKAKPGEEIFKARRVGRDYRKNLSQDIKQLLRVPVEWLYYHFLQQLIRDEEIEFNDTLPDVQYASVISTLESSSNIDPQTLKRIKDWIIEILILRTQEQQYRSQLEITILEVLQKKQGENQYINERLMGYADNIKLLKSVAELPAPTQEKSSQIKKVRLTGEQKKIISALKRYGDKLLNRNNIKSALAYYVWHDANDTVLSREKAQEPARRHALDQDRIVPFLQADDEPVMLLQGASGAGKSLYSHWLMKQCWADWTEHKGMINRVPILIDLKDLSGKKKLKKLKGFLKKQCGLSNEQYNVLQSLPLLLIFEGYDEKQGKDCNLYTKYKLSGFKDLKVLITCRSQYLQQRRYKVFFTVDEFFKEVYIAPFSQAQVATFLDQFLTTHTTKWSKKQYIDTLAAHPALAELIESPLLLRMVVTALPKLHKIEEAPTYHERLLHRPTITRALIYQEFISDWFERSAEKFYAKLKTSEVELWEYETLPSQDAFRLYCQRLAFRMFAAHPKETLTQIPYQQRATHARKGKTKIAQWEAFFTTKDPNLSEIRNACPLQCTADQYQFFHRSFLEYFAAGHLYDALLDEEEWLAGLGENPLNKKCLNSEPSIIRFLMERIVKEECLVDRLLKIVLASRQNGSAVKIAAGNAMTVMNAGHVNFSGLDFFGVNIKGADLRGAYCDGTNFEGAILCDVELARAWLRKSNLRQCDLTNVAFGEMPYIKHDDEIECIAYQSEINRILSGSGRRMTLWDTETGECLREFSCEARVLSVALSRDGKTIVAGCRDMKVRVHKAPWADKPIVLSGHTSEVNSVSLSHDGSRVASGSKDKTVRAWIGGEAIVLSGHTEEVTCVSLSHDGSRVASGSEDKTVRVWNASGGEAIAVLTGHTDYVTSVSLRGSRVASGSDDNTVRVWDASGGEVTAVLRGHTEEVTCVSLSHDGSRVASGSWDNTVRMWDASGGEATAVLRGHTNLVNGVCLSGDGSRVASGSDDGTVRVWDASGGGATAVLTGHTDRVNSVALSHDGSRVVSGSTDDTVRVWIGGELTAVLTGHTSLVYSVSLSHDGSRVASGSYDNTVRVWNASGGEATAVLTGHTGWVNSVSLSHDGVRVASGSRDKTVRVWNASGGEAIVLTGHTSVVNSVSLSHDGSRVASGSEDQTVRVWDASSGEPTAVLTGHTGRVWSVSLSHDGARVASGSQDKTVRVWNASGGEAIVLAGHTNVVYSVSLSGDGSRVASGSDDNTVRVWDVASAELRSIIHVHSSINSIALHDPSGKLVVGSEDGSVQCWQRLNENGTSWQLQWTTNTPNSTLHLTGCDATGALGLSNVNRRLLSQRGAIVDPPRLASTLTQVASRSGSPLHSPPRDASTLSVDQDNKTKRSPDLTNRSSGQ